MGSCQISKSQINCDLIEIIQFFLRMYDLWRHPTQGWVDGWVTLWVIVWGHVESLKIE